MRIAVVLASAAALSTSACRMDWSERTTGTIIGTAGGAAVGALAGSAAGNPLAGAAIGAAAGGAAGYIIGDKMADKRERQQATAGASGSGSGADPTALARGVEPMPGPGPGPEVLTVSWPSPDRIALARTEYEAGRNAKRADVALQHYDSAIRLDPTRPEPYHARGLILQYQGHREDAKRAFAQALAVDPGYTPAEESLAKLSASR